MTDDIEKLLKMAGPRAEIPDEIEERTYELVQREWQASSQQPDGSNIYKKVRKAWRRDARVDRVFRWSLPLGGVVAAALAIFVLMQPDPVPLISIATVSKVVQPDAATSPYSSGMTLFAGDSISTGEDEGLGLLLARRESLRIDENTEIRIDARDRFTLVRGRVYADTGQFVYRDGGLIIETEFGTVTDVGTQFSVSSRDQALDVAVREGRVDIAAASAVLVVMVGERMLLQSSAEPLVEKIGANDGHWAWAADLAPDFDIENRSLFDFLRWAARETGRELVFENDELRMATMRNDVHGSIANLTPDEALRAILPTTSLRYQIEPDKIIIKQ